MTDTGWSTPFHIDAGAHSVVGKVRDHNEDAFRIDMKLGLFAVADGLGGHQAGEHASGLAVEVLGYELERGRNSGSPPSVELVLEAVHRANLAILDDAANHSERRGMGTTLTAMVVTGRRMLLGHVGDSRAWRIRDGVIEQLTHDHTMVEQQVRAGVLSPEDASVHPMRHILSRCLGLREEVEVDLLEIGMAADDVYVLASDGLVPGMPPEQMVLLVQQNQDSSMAAQVLVNQACDRDGQDNITAVVVACRER